MASRGQLERAAQAAELLAQRRDADPLRTWEPTSSQARFLESPKPETWLLGANRSGKTDALAALLASYLRFGHPDPRPCFMRSGHLVLTDRAVAIWAISLTFPVLRDTLEPKIFQSPYGAGHSHPPFVPPWEIQSFHVTDRTLHHKNGGLINFKSAEGGRQVFQAAGRDVIGFDEVPPLDVYTECTLRVEAGKRLLIRGAATILPPEGVIGGVSWLYDKKVRPWLANEKRDPHLDIFSASIRDNPHLLPSEIERLEDLYPPGSIERRIRLDGELLPSIGGVLAYPAFHRALHLDPSLSPASVVPTYPLRLCCDFNVAPSIWTVCQRINDTWFVLDELVMEHGSIPAMCDEFRRRFPHHGAELILHGDATGQFRNAQSGLSNWYVIQECLQSYPVPVRLAIPKYNPAVMDRVNAMNRQLRHADGRIGLLVAPHCEETLADFEEVLRDHKGGIKKSNHQADPYSRRTHATDGLGCAICFTDPVPRAVRRMSTTSPGMARPMYQAPGAMPQGRGDPRGLRPVSFWFGRGPR